MPIEVGGGQAAPTRGEPVTVRATGKDGAPIVGKAVHALYLPNSKTERREQVGTTGSDGAVSWTPTAPGIATVEVADGGSQTVAVRFDAFPISGLVVFVLAGALIFGGLLKAYRSLMRTG